MMALYKRKPRKGGCNWNVALLLACGLAVLTAKNLGKEVRKDQAKLRAQKDRVVIRKIQDLRPAPDPARPAPGGKT